LASTGAAQPAHWAPATTLALPGDGPAIDSVDSVAAFVHALGFSLERQRRRDHEARRAPAHILHGHVMPGVMIL
jgi:hypothetical protein